MTDADIYVDAIDKAIGLPDDLPEDAGRKLKLWRDHRLTATRIRTPEDMAQYMADRGMLPPNNYPQTPARDRQLADSPPELSPLPAGELVRVPVVSLALAHGYHPAVGQQSFIDEFGGDSADWRPLPAGHQLFRVEGTSGLPEVQPGGIVEVDLNRWPRSGEFCVALTSVSDYPLLKYYYRKNYRVLLKSANEDDGTDYEFDLKDEHGDRFHWARPVVDVLRGGGLTRPAPQGW